VYSHGGTVTIAVTFRSAHVLHWCVGSVFLAAKPEGAFLFVLCELLEPVGQK